LLYVGSTTDFRRRKATHKNKCNNENDKNYNLKVYTMIRENGGWKAFEIKPYQEFPCESSLQLQIQEEKVRKELNANLNMIKAYTSKEERKEYIKEYQSKKERKEYIKEYYENNKNKIKEYSAKFYQENIKKIKEKYECDCGSICGKGNKAHHEKTQKHISYLAKN